MSHQSKQTHTIFTGTYVQQHTHKHMHTHKQGLKFESVLNSVFRKSSFCHLRWRNINHFWMFPLSPLFKINLRKVATSHTLTCNIKNKMVFLWNCYNGTRWTKYASHWKTQIHLPQNKNCSGVRNQWTYQIQSGNFLASTFKLPTLLPSWINTAFGKVKPVRSSSESPWVNYNVMMTFLCLLEPARGSKGRSL